MPPKGGHPPHYPSRECFAIIGPEEPPAGGDPPPAARAGERPTPEQIEARWQELEETHRSLEREEAALNAAMIPHARIRMRNVGHQIAANETDLPKVARARQNIGAAALLARQLPPPAMPNERWAQHGLRTMLERAMVQQTNGSSDWHGHLTDDPQDSKCYSLTDRHGQTGKQKQAATPGGDTTTRVDPAPAHNDAPMHERLGPECEARLTINSRRRNVVEEPEGPTP